MPAMQTTTPTYILAAELVFLGSRCRILATSASTDGKYGLVDMIEVPAGNMPPLHIHHTHDEGFLLLEGEVSLFLPQREITLRRGEFVLAPRGIPHTYQVGDSPARWLVLSTPPGFELGHRPGRTEDLDAVHGARFGQRVWRDFVERSDVFDELLEAGGC